MSKKVPRMALMVALAMIFSYVEALIPINFGLPGMKLGLANLVVVIGLYLFPAGEIFLISMIRILLVGVLFGNGTSIIYSLAGGILSFLVMLLIKQIKGFSITGVSIAGGVTHNIGQIAAAAFLLENTKIVYYLPVLLVSGAVTGLIIGVLAGRIIPVIRRTGYVN